MQIWLDTINLELIKEATQVGVISGITTNPSILSKAKDVKKTLSVLLQLQNGPVAVQVTTNAIEGMISEGRALFALSNRFIIKIPVSKNGLIAIKQLRRENIPVLGTAVFHPMQAVLASQNGANWIAPYFAHMGEEGQQSLKTMATLLKNTGTQILVASLRSVEHIVSCALLEVAAVTLKEELYSQLITPHPLLDKLTEKFLFEWTESQGDVSIQELVNRENLA